MPITDYAQLAPKSAAEAADTLPTGIVAPCAREGRALAAWRVAAAASGAVAGIAAGVAAILI
ncbi:hypothetical protein [Microbacterium sp. No. 7]|uniref:hypothetical protein n=1 Tax=Microbacterium sp. No. 7 TaxID=1714373 RepID=UPI0012E2A2F0|nr:hypothetical protein [Microbacterium sp. No. 7]